MANVKVTIDRDQCISCESCWTICPEVFEQNSGDSWSQIVAAYRIGGDPAIGQFPDALKAKVQEAEDACPVAIYSCGLIPRRTKPASEGSIRRHTWPQGCRSRGRGRS